MSMNYQMMTLCAVRCTEDIGDIHRHTNRGGLPGTPIRKIKPGASQPIYDVRNTRQHVLLGRELRLSYIYICVCIYIYIYI